MQPHQQDHTDDDSSSDCDNDGTASEVAVMTMM